MDNRVHLKELSDTRYQQHGQCEGISAIMEFVNLIYTHVYMCEYLLSMLRPFRWIVSSKAQDERNLWQTPFSTMLPIARNMHLSLLFNTSRFIYEPRHDKPTKVSVRPAKTKINLDIRPVWSESSLRAQLVGKDPSFLHADSEDSEQTGRMPRLTWVFAGRTLTLLVLSCRGSYGFSHGAFSTCT